MVSSLSKQIQNIAKRERRQQCTHIPLLHFYLCVCCAYFQKRNSIVFPLHIEYVTRCHCSRCHSIPYNIYFGTFGFTGYILAYIYFKFESNDSLLYIRMVCGVEAAVGLALLIKSKHSLEYTFSFLSFRMHKRKMR